MGSITVSKKTEHHVFKHDEPNDPLTTLFEPLVTIKEDLNLRNFINAFSIINDSSATKRNRSQTVELESCKSKSVINEYFNSQLAQNIMIVLKQIEKKHGDINYNIKNMISFEVTDLNSLYEIFSPQSK